MQHRRVLWLAVGASALLAFFNYCLCTAVGPSSSSAGFSSMANRGCSSLPCEEQVLGTGNLKLRENPHQPAVRIEAQRPTNNNGTGATSDAQRLPEVPRFSLHLIGERHSGTKWISGQLQKCFRGVRFSNKFHRWKHWFQEDSDEYFGRHFPDQQRFVVVAQFRHPYSWTAAMQSHPHHATEHMGLNWSDFVTRPWTTPHIGIDKQFEGWTADTTAEERVGAGECVDSFLPHQIIPCVGDRRRIMGVTNPSAATGTYMEEAYYELRQDGSGLPYNSILELRRDKIHNHLSVANFSRVQDFIPVRYENLQLFGTASLIRQVEQALDVKATCEPLPGNASWRDTRIAEPEAFRVYLESHIDWETEAKIGYSPTYDYSNNNSS